jgi:hypothetical protein
MQCADCERLWKLYDHRRKIYVDLIRGAKWGTRYLKDALERANTERQDTREQYLQRKRPANPGVGSGAGCGPKRGSYEGDLGQFPPVHGWQNIREIVLHRHSQSAAGFDD